jgi:nitrogen fixation protein FixH
MSAGRLPLARPRGSWIPWLFVAFLLVILAANGALIWLALGSWAGVATEEAYAKGLAYNRNLEAARAQAALGWRSELDVRIAEGLAAEIRFVLTDARGSPIEDAEVTAAFERPAQPGADFRLPLASQGGGAYGAAFALPLAGLWRVHLTARHGDDLFVRDDRVDLR